MADENSFLIGIQENPTDRSIRLTYADWLKKEGDSRAELIYVEEEMRGLLVFGDRYWELKERRNIFRKGVKKDWLQTMKYGTDYEPIFGKVPKGWKERWRLLREFTERWYGVPMGDVGGRAEIIAKIEDSLNVKLPPSFREWIAFTADLADKKRIKPVIDTRRNPSRCEVRDLPDLSAISLFFLTLDGSIKAVKKKNLVFPDPLVDTFCKFFSDTSAEDFHYAPLSNFPKMWPPYYTIPLTTMVFEHLLCGLKGKRKGSGQSEKVAALMPHEIAQTAGSTFPVQGKIDHLQIFEGVNIIGLLRPPEIGSLHIWPFQVVVRGKDMKVPPIGWLF